MELTLAIHPVTDIRLGPTTRLVGTLLEVNRDELRRHLLEDQRLRSVDIEVVRPGENCRVGVVFDVLEPRAKAPGSGSDFPGVLGAFSLTGQGTTHVLRGAAVSVLDDGAPAGIGGKVLEMSGPAAQASVYGALQHVVVVPHPAPEIERHSALNATRLASVKAAVYLAKAALAHKPASTEVFDLDPGVRRPGKLRIAYIAQIHGHQRVSEVDEQILYGSNTVGMVPVPLHPNEILDGGLICSYWNMQVETYFYQNNPVVLELYRRHQAGELDFAGVVATVAVSNEDDRDRNCMLAAHLAKWNLGADAVLLTKYGGGAPHADMGLTAHFCEQMGLRTAVEVTDMSGDRRAESALLFNYPEVNAITYVGGNDTKWKVPAAERVIAGGPAVAAVLAAPQELSANSVCGVTNQQGASHLRSVVY